MHTNKQGMPATHTGLGRTLVADADADALDACVRMSRFALDFCLLGRLDRKERSTWLNMLCALAGADCTALALAAFYPACKMLVGDMNICHEQGMTRLHEPRDS